MDKPVSEACLRNQEPIAEALARILTEPATVLEIGSGTGQHAVHIGRRLPHLLWQPSDLAECLPGIHAWLQEAGLANVLNPVVLDVRQQPWLLGHEFDAVFTANTIHFVGWRSVESLLRGTAGVLRAGGLFCVYGPFNYGGQYTSEGNRQLDLWLKGRDPDSGIKDIEEVRVRAEALGLLLQQDLAMPANNRLLVFQKT